MSTAIGCVAALALILAARQVAWWIWKACVREPAAPAPHRRLRRVAIPAVIVAVLGAGLTALVLAGDLHGIDGIVSQRLAPWRSASLVVVWQFVTDMGSSGGATIVTVVASVLLWRSGRAADLRPLWLAVVGATATIWATKYALALPRPVFVTSTVALSPTFPSAHAGSALALYGILACLVGRGLAPRPRFEVGYWAAVLIAAIGFSRVFLGVHNPSDVAAGYRVGGFWLLVALPSMAPRGNGAA
jgi:undecaprenyl-diphosphatase